MQPRPYLFSCLNSTHFFHSLSPPPLPTPSSRFLSIDLIIPYTLLLSLLAHHQQWILFSPFHPSIRAHKQCSFVHSRKCSSVPLSSLPSWLQKFLLHLGECDSLLLCSFMRRFRYLSPPFPYNNYSFVIWVSASVSLV